MTLTLLVLNLETWFQAFYRLGGCSIWRRIYYTPQRR